MSALTATARPASVAACPAPADRAVECADAPLPVLGRDIAVPLVTGGEVEYAALDYAASAPALQRVWDDVAAYAPYYASVHRGAGHLSQLSTKLFEDARAEVARFLGCREDDQLLFTRSTTDSLNLLAGALPGNCRVLVFESEHHAALLPWPADRLTVLPAPRSHAEAVRTLGSALAALGEEAPGAPVLACVTGASNVTGELWPVRELAAVAHEYGARLVLDAAQLAPHHRVDLTELDVDWVAFSGHKLYAPFGAGVLAGRADWLRAAPPYLAGGGATRSVARTAGGGLEADWHETAARHEAGSPNVIGAHALASACRALSEAGFEALAAREQRLLDKLLTGLATLPEVSVLSLFGADSARVGVVSLTVQGWNCSHLAAALSAEYGIGVRDGLFCAHPLLRVLQGAGRDESGECGATDTGDTTGLGAVRVSFGAGTPEEHIDRFLTALTTLLRDGARWEYRTEGGRCLPVPADGADAA